MAELVDALVLGTNMSNVKVRVLFALPLINIMKVTIENKKGLNKDLKVLIDKKTMKSYMDEKYEEIKEQLILKVLDLGKFLEKF